MIKGIIRSRLFCFLVFSFLSVDSLLAYRPQEGTDGGTEWSIKIIRPTDMVKQTAILEVILEGGTKASFSHVIYEKRIDPSVFENTKTVYSFFENFEIWDSFVVLGNEQKKELDDIRAKFEEQLREIVQSQVAQVNDKDGGDLVPRDLSSEQISAIASRLIPLEASSEELAMRVLLPHQQRVVFKEHFDTLGWKVVNSVYGTALLGLNEKQIDKIASIVAEFEARNDEATTRLKKEKTEIALRLWETVAAELTVDQKERLAIFREAFVKRLQSRTKQNHIEEEYDIEGVDMRVVSYKRMNGEIFVDEKCTLSCSVNKFQESVENLNLFEHTLGGFGVNELPVVGNQRYVLGITLTAEETESIHAARDEFLIEIARHIKSESKKGKPNSLFVGSLAAHAKKFSETSSKCFAILDKQQQQILLENRIGNEILRRGIHVFKSSVFCKEMNIDEGQKTRIENLIRLADEKIASNEREIKENRTEVLLATEKTITQVLTPEQRKILEETR